MAGKATSVYLSIVQLEDHKIVLNKMFLNATALNDWLKEHSDKYPKPEYYIVKESY
jgi:hypothetical protein